MAKCDICGKTTSFGRNVSHSKRHTSKRIMANVQRATLILAGKVAQVYACTRCLRSHYKATA